MSDVRDYHYLQQSRTQTQFFPVPKRDTEEGRRRRREKQYLERIKPFTGVPRGFYRVSEMQSPLDLSPAQADGPPPSAPPAPPAYRDAIHFPTLPPGRPEDRPPPRAPQERPPPRPPPSAPPAPEEFAAPPEDDPYSEDDGYVTPEEDDLEVVLPEAPTTPVGYNTDPRDLPEIPQAPSSPIGYNTDPRDLPILPIIDQPIMGSRTGRPLNIQEQMNGRGDVPGIIDPLRQLRRDPPTQFERYNFERQRAENIRQRFQDARDRIVHERYMPGGAGYEEARARFEGGDAEMDIDEDTEQPREGFNEREFSRNVRQRRTYLQGPFAGPSGPFEIGVRRRRDRNRLLEIAQAVDPNDMYDLDLENL